LSNPFIAIEGPDDRHSVCFESASKCGGKFLIIFDMQDNGRIAQRGAFFKQTVIDLVMVQQSSFLSWWDK